MVSKKICLLSIAALALGVAVTACSGDDDDGSSTYSMASGTYALDITDVPTNTCWPVSNPLPIDLTVVSLDLDIISTNGASFQIQMPPAVSAFLPNIEGSITGNALSAAGNVTDYALNTSGCILSIHATADGELTGNNEFNIDPLTATLTVDAADTCADLVGSSIPGTMDLVPFPTLTNVSNGTCSISLVGDGVFSE